MRALIEFLLRLFSFLKIPPKVVPPAPPAPQKPPSGWQPCMDWVFKMEGGFVNNPTDPGGATNRGITIGELEQFRGHPVTVDDVRNLTVDEASKIYYHDYWHANRCDEMPPGLNLAFYDACVMSSAVRMRKLLQQSLGVTPDGIIGNDTMSAIRRRVDVENIIVDFCHSRLQYLKSLPTWPTFGGGWTRRVNDTMDEAIRLAR